MTATYWDLLQWRATRTPDRVFLVDDSGDRATAAEVVARAEATAAALAGRGIRPGDCVSWILPSTVSAAVLTFALARVGAVQNPLIPIYGAKEVDFITRQTGSRLLITPGVFRGIDFAAMARGLSHVASVTLDALADGPSGELPPPPTDDSTVRWLFYTSGTTSEPKGVRHSDRTILAAGRALRGRGSLPGGRWGGAVPIAHIGVPTMLALGLDIGMTMHLIAVFDPERSCDALRDWQVDEIAGVGAVVTALLERQRSTDGRAFPALRTLLAGGGPKIPSLDEAVRHELGAQLLSSYGMTEMPYCTAGAPGDPGVVSAIGEGRPTVGSEVRIVDRDDRVLPDGEEGEVRVRGPQLFLGYVDPQLEHAAMDADGFFRSGDLGYLAPEGHLVLTGRLKEVIVRNGENLSVREIENILLQHPDVADAAVIGLPHSVTGESVCAVVMPRPGASVDLATLRDHCTENQLMRQKLPERVVIVEAFPRNAMGKIQKQLLRQQLLATSR